MLRITPSLSQLALHPGAPRVATGHYKSAQGLVGYHTVRGHSRKLANKWGHALGTDRQHQGPQAVVRHLTHLPNFGLSLIGQFLNLGIKITQRIGENLC